MKPSTRSAIASTIPEQSQGIFMIRILERAWIGKVGEPAMGAEPTQLGWIEGGLGSGAQKCHSWTTEFER